MNLLVFRLGEIPVVVAAQQVAHVSDSPGDARVPVVELDRAIGLPPTRTEQTRLLVCAPPARAAFIVPAALSPLEAPAGSLLKLPALLRRLRPPPWLAGLARIGEGLALVIDLHSLAASTVHIP